MGNFILSGETNEVILYPCSFFIKLEDESVKLVPSKGPERRWKDTSQAGQATGGLPSPTLMGYFHNTEEYIKALPCNKQVYNWSILLKLLVHVPTCMNTSLDDEKALKQGTSEVWKLAQKNEQFTGLSWPSLGCHSRVCRDQLDSLQRQDFGRRSCAHAQRPFVAQEDVARAWCQLRGCRHHPGDELSHRGNSHRGQGVLLRQLHNQRHGRLPRQRYVLADPPE